MLEEKNKEMDRSLKIEEVIDEKNEKIQALERELQRKEDEVNLRKEVIDSMGVSLMKHENETRELATRLVMMKNQMMSNEINKSIGRKFAAVRIGSGIKTSLTPVSVSSPASLYRSNSRSSTSTSTC
jgi:hypothetical protein